MPQPSPYHRNLAWWVAASAAAHVLVMHGLPGWQPAEDKTPPPLHVELRQPPPQIEPPKPLPVEPPRPLPRERPKPAAEKPIAEKAAPREPAPVEPPRSPLLTAPVEAPLTAATPAVPEPKPAPPPEPPPRMQPAPAPPPPPAPVTPPRSDAAHLSNPPPNYPLAARRRGEQGTVLVRLVVTADGMAKNVGVEKSSGHPALDEAAVAAVRSWRFVPARQGGQALEWPYTQPVQFKLD